jgi:hypothetical protein
MKRYRRTLKPRLMAALLVAPALGRCGGDDGTSAAQCQDWSNQASIGRRAAQNQAGRACSADPDCTIVDYGLRCFADCGYPSAVASSAVPALEATIQEIDENNCDRFEGADCAGPIHPPCATPSGAPSAVCRLGRCTLEFTP